MRAHLIDQTGIRAVVDVPAFPKEPRIIEHQNQQYAVNDPGFTFFGGPPAHGGIGEYMEYYAAVPYKT